MDIALIIAVAALVTWFTRALPFMIFSGKELPQKVIYLGRVLPPAIMMVLVCYCLKNTDIINAPHGIPEIISCLLIIIIHNKWNNMYVSIVAGTICYMALIRIL